MGVCVVHTVWFVAGVCVVHTVWFVTGVCVVHTVWFVAGVRGRRTVINVIMFVSRVVSVDISLVSIIQVNTMSMYVIIYVIILVYVGYIW